MRTNYQILRAEITEYFSLPNDLSWWQKSCKMCSQIRICLVWNPVQFNACNNASIKISLLCFLKLSYVNNKTVIWWLLYVRLGPRRSFKNSSHFACVSSGVRWILEGGRGQIFRKKFLFDSVQGGVSQTGSGGGASNRRRPMLRIRWENFSFFLAKITLFGDNSWLNSSTNCFQNI